MKKTITIIIKTFLILATALAITGCAPTQKQIDYTNYYWPKEPLKTRLRLLRVISSDLDIRQMSAGESLFGGSTYFKFKKPHSVVVDVDNNIYVTDTYNRTVYIINMQNGSVRLLKKPGGWSMPMGLGIDNINHLLAITDNKTVIIMNYKTSQVIRVLGQTEGFKVPNGLAFDPSNRFLYVGDTKGSAIYKYDYDGQRIATVATVGTGPENVYFPAHMAVDRSGRLFVADTMNWKIKIFGPDGSFIKSFGEHGSVLGQFNRPKGLSVSKDGIIGITDNDLGLFMLMNEDGQVYTFKGGIGSKPAQFIVPQGIFISDDDKIYVVDQVNRRLQVFQMYTDKYYSEHPEAIPASTPATTTAAPEAATDGTPADTTPDGATDDETTGDGTAQ